MLELLLIRHGQTAWNAKRKVMGRRPIPLNERGQRQAEGVAAYLKDAPIDRIFTSPVARARQTAQIIAGPHAGLTVEEHEGFTEIDYGKWTDYGFDDLPVHFAEGWRQYRADPASSVFPGGESMRDAAARICAAVDGIVASDSDSRVAVVSHADVLKVALTHALGLGIDRLARFAIDNCAVLIVRLGGEGGSRLVLANQLNGFGNDMRISEAVKVK